MIHQYKSLDLNIVLDVESGAIHVVDDVCYDVIHALDCLESTDEFFEVKGDEICVKPYEEIKPYLEFMVKGFNDDDLREAYEETGILIKDEKLFSSGTYEKDVIVFKNRVPLLKALCLHVAHDCNLACKYCFAGKGEYNGKAGIMSLETGKRAIDFLIENSGNRHNLEVDFFGGEPLLNFNVVKELVAYARSLEDKHNKKFRFTLTTNGLLLNDDILEFVNKEMGNLVLSVDGRKAVHDKMRPTSSGAGSYDLIINKFKKAADSRNQVNYYVRGTYTHYNTDFANDVIALADEGFEQISVEPVVADEKEDYAIKESDIDTLIKQYDVLLCEMVKRRNEGKAFNFFHFMIDLTGGPCIYKRLNGCGSGNEYMAVTPSGDLYPCHQLVSNDEFYLGNVFDGIKNKNLADKFKDINIYSKESCKNCFAKYYCSGGCAANSYNFSGDINGSYETGCTLMKKRVECAIALKVSESL